MNIGLLSSTQCSDSTPFMAFPLLLLLLTIFPPLSSSQTPQQQQQQLLLLDELIANSTSHSSLRHHKTAVLYPIHLPSNLSGITAHFVRFRSGSLRRRGATIEEFTIPPGIVVVRPPTKRLIVIRQNLGNFSSLFYNVSGYKLISPVLGLLFYPRHHQLLVEKGPITVDFSKLVDESSSGLCARFGVDGSVRVWNETRGGRRHVCVTWGEGHFGLVVVEEEEGRGRHVRDTWKVVVVGVVGVGFGVVMVGLVVVAVAGERRRRRKGRVEEEERRREYEEEAMRVAMVGHVRAPVAAVARTAPAIENDYYDPVLS